MRIEPSTCTLEVTKSGALTYYAMGAIRYMNYGSYTLYELSGPKALLFLQPLIAFITRSAVNDCASPMVSLVTIRVSLKEVCLPSFEVLNCWLNLVVGCLDEENELSLMVVASFTASRFALSSIPLIVLHSLVRSVF